MSKNTYSYEFFLEVNISIKSIHLFQKKFLKYSKFFLLKPN